MKCPNCGEEAINVNGKFVCLDCGIQLEAASAAGGTAADPQILNHSASPALATEEDSGGVLATDPTLNESVHLGEKQVERPVQNLYEQALTEVDGANQGGSVDFHFAAQAEVGATPTKSAIPDFPNMAAPVATDPAQADVATPVLDVPIENNFPDPNVFPPADLAANPQPEILGQIEPQLTNPIDTTTEPKLEVTTLENVTIPQEAASIELPITENFELKDTETVDNNPGLLPEETALDPVASIAVETAPLPVDDSITAAPLEEKVVTEQPVPTNDIPIPAISENLSTVPETISDENSFNSPFSVSSETGDPTVSNVAATITAAPKELVQDWGGSISAIENNQGENPETTEVAEPSPGYFQPQEMPINQAQSFPPDSTQNATFDAYSTPSGAAGFNEPMIGSLEGRPETNIEVKEPVPTTEETEKVAPKSLEDLLNETTSQESAAPAPTSNFSPAMNFDSLKSTDSTPPAKNPELQGGIPSVESVFGSAPESMAKNVSAKSTGLSKKVIIIGSAVIGLLLIVGGVFGFIAYKKSATKKKQLLIEQEMLKTSGKVANAMDAPMNLTVKFEEKLDFSKVTFSGDDDKEELKKISEKPFENKGFWKTDEVGNVMIESNLEKKVYKSEKNKTLVFTDKWTEKDGYDLLTAPITFDPESKGELFYLTRVNQFIKVAGESIDGETLTKIRVIPKAELMQEIIGSASPLLAKTNYSSINYENLQIFAWVNKENLIKKITISGDVGVNSDLFNGTVSINSVADYGYEVVQITMPTAFGLEIVPPKEKKVNEVQIPKKLEIVDARG